MQYRREIDGLRALAVLPVMLFHAGFSLFGGGFVGVDVFFVISGFLITTILLTEIRSGTFSLLTFYERRARRILPPLFLVMALCLPIAWLWLVPSDMKDFAQSLVAVSFFSSNLLFWQEAGYFQTAAEFKPLLHTWSLAVEEQYYMLFPLLLLFLFRFCRQWIGVALIGLGLLSLASAQWGVRHAPDAAFFLLPARAWELLVGSLLAFWVARRTVPLTVLLAQASSALGLLLLIYAIFVFDKSTPFPGLQALVPTLGTALIILGATPRTIVGRLLGSRLLVGIGLVSYSAYLWHQPLFAFVRHIKPEASQPEIFLALILTSLVLAYLSWRFVERPFRDRQRVNRRMVALVTGGFTLFFVAAGLAGHFTSGFDRQRVSDEQRSVLATALPSPQREACHTGGEAYRTPAQACTFNDGPPRWAVFGDSHAVELAFAMAQELEPQARAIRQFTFSGCVPIYGQVDDPSPCARWTREAVSHILNDAALKDVVVSYRIHAALFGDQLGVFPAMPASVSGERRERMWAAYVQILRTFVDAGKRVTLVLQAPELPAAVESLVFRVGQDVRDVPGVSRVWWNARSTFVRDRLHELPQGVTIVDPAALFCQGAQCLAVKAGTALYFDDDHMSLGGAAQVAKAVLLTHPLRINTDP